MPRTSPATAVISTPTSSANQVLPKIRHPTRIGRSTAATNTTKATTTANARCRVRLAEGACHALSTTATAMATAPAESRAPTSPSVVFDPPFAQIIATLANQATPPATASAPARRGIMSQRYVRWPVLAMDLTAAVISRPRTGGERPRISMRGDRSPPVRQPLHGPRAWRRRPARVASPAGATTRPKPAYSGRTSSTVPLPATRVSTMVASLSPLRASRLRSSSGTMLTPRFLIVSRPTPRCRSAARRAFSW